MFPSSAIIVCYDYDEYRTLMQYLDDQGFQYGSESHKKRMGQRWKYGELKYTSPFCHHFSRNNGSGYCSAVWYQEHDEYWNKLDARWNFCSVAEFITWTSGSCVPEDELQLPSIEDIL